VATVNQVTGDGQMSLPVWGVVLVAGLLLGGLAIGFIGTMLRRRRRSRISDR
jgi:protein involved in polysaccharide export with SLBB domain